MEDKSIQLVLIKVSVLRENYFSYFEQFTMNYAVFVLYEYFVLNEFVKQDRDIHSKIFML